MGVEKGEIAAAAKNAGFTNIEARAELLCSGHQDMIHCSDISICTRQCGFCPAVYPSQ